MVGGGEPSETESRNQPIWAPATPLKLKNPEIMRFASSGEAGEEESVNSNEISCGEICKPMVDFIDKWKECSFQELLKQAEAGIMPTAITPSPPPNIAWGPAVNRHISHEISAPHQLPYDLNLTPENNFGASLDVTVPKFAPVTPNKLMTANNLIVEDTTHREREKENTTTVENVIEPDSNEEGARPSGDSLLPANPAEFQENLNPESEKLENSGTDLKTPQQKQRRRKHRPRVITERKPRTPKLATPKTTDSKENPTKKRKYVRKNAKEKASDTPSDVAGQWDKPKERMPRKRSCRRTLNFGGMEEEYEDSRFCSLDVNFKSQAHQLSSRSVSKVTIELCKGIEEVEAGKIQAQSTYESVVQGVLGTQPCPIILSDSDSSSTVNPAEREDRAKEYKGNYSHAVKQANAGRKNLNEAHYSSVQAYNLITWQNNTRKRTEKAQHTVASSATVLQAEKHFGRKVVTSDDNKVSEALIHISRGVHDTPRTNGCIVIDLSPNTRPTKKRSRSATRARSWDSLTRIDQQPKNCIDALIAETRATLARKRRTRKINSLVLQNQVSYSDQQSHSRFSGVLSKAASRKMFSVDEIEKQLKCLDINKESCRFVCRERNAIVPFTGRHQEHNALVPYVRDGLIVPFEPVKKPRPRAKVNLDEETTRVWKLLLENINSEGIDGIDEDKAKWWEEERKVFRGRANSFIARMHLVQGDRRFSRWKGSVLDSVVGVFLTQNVSDHLSSSAFMSLAARFPLKSRNHSKACILSEPKMCIRDNAVNQPACGSSFTPCDAEDNEKTGSNKQETYGSYIVEHYTEQEGKAAVSLMSLRQSMDSSVSQTCDKTGSCSESNSDAEDLDNKGKPDSLEESAILLENPSTSKSSIPREVYCGSGETTFNLKFKENCMESKASENDGNSQKMDKADPKITLESSKEPASGHLSCEIVSAEVSIIESFEIFRKETQSSDVLEIKTECSGCDQSSITVEFASENTIENQMTTLLQEAPSDPREPQAEKNTLIETQKILIEKSKGFEAMSQEKHTLLQQVLPNYSEKVQVVVKDTIESQLNEHGHSFSKEFIEIDATTSKPKSRGGRKDPKDKRDWDELRRQAEVKGKREQNEGTMDSLDWEAVRCAAVNEIADAIKERGMNNKLAERIQEFLNRLVREHGSTDLEWLRDVPPDQAKEYLLSMRGLGLKSVECVRLLTLHHLAFPVDTNVGRIAVRLGWVPLQPLPESLQLHLLELYPVLESIQKYLWPRLCKLDQRTLYELHYQMITFGKVFCTKNKPNCNSCPMRGECRHFASAFASARLALPGPEEKSIVIATEKGNGCVNHTGINEKAPLPLPHAAEQSKQNQDLVATNKSEAMAGGSYCEPIIEEPATPEPECTIGDIEDVMYSDDCDEIPTIRLDSEAFTENVHNYMQQNMELQEGDTSKALVALDLEAASIPMPKLKNVNQLRTEHQVYELPDDHPLLEMLQMDKREPDDPSPYLLAIWTPGETANSTEPPARRCHSQGLDKLCDDEECFSCNSIREANSQTVRGTILIPCRTAMRGSFPLNGTYFQVNEVFADNDSSLNPIAIPRALIWNLPRRTVYFGTSIPTIFKGLTTQGIQLCFWRGYVCVRGFDKKSRAPRPLIARLHFPASKGKRTRDPKTHE